MKIYKAIGLILMLLFSTILMSQSITQHPINDTVCAGGNASFNIYTTGELATYKWQVYEGMGWNDIVGEESLSLNVLNCSISYDSYEYRCIIVGLDTSDAAVLRVYNDPTWDVISLNPTNICVGGEIAFSATYTDGFGGSVDWVRSASSMGAGSIINTPNIESLAGTFYYRPQYTSTVSGCSLTDGSESIINIVEDPIWVSNSAAPSSVCQGGSIVFNASVTGGLSGSVSWIRAINTGGVGTPVISPYPENTTGSYYYRPTYSSTVSGCSLADGTESIVNVVADPIWTTNSATPSNVCQGGSIVFNASISGGVGGNISWIRAVSSGGIGSSVVSPIIENVAGTFYYRPIYNSTVSGCNLSNGTERIITVVSDPTWGISSAPISEICAGGQISFSTSINGGIGGSLEWVRALTPGGTGSIITSPNLESNAGTFYYRPRYVSTVSGCNLSDGGEQTITVVSDPTWFSNTVSPTSICEGGQVVFNAAFNGGTGGNLSWVRSISPGIEGTIVTSPIIENISGTYYYRPRYNSTVSGCNLIDGTERLISVVSDPVWNTISIPTTDICEGGQITFSTSFTGGYGGNSEWLRANSPNGSGTTVTSPIIENNDGVFYFRPRYISTISGCNLTDGAETVINVVNDPVWNSIIVTPQSICTGEEVNFIADFVGGFGGGINWLRAIISNGAGQSINSPYIEDLSGSFYYRPQYTPTASGCNLSDGQETTIIVKPRPSISNIQMTQSICSGMNSQSVLLQSDLANTTINWLITDVTQGVTGFLNNMTYPNSFIPIQTLYNSGSSDGTISYSISTNADGCQGQETFYTITVKPLPVVYAGMDKAICYGDSIQLQSSLGENYVWLPSESLNLSNIFDPIASPIQTTEYAVTVNDINGCSNSDIVLVTVNPLPELAIGASETTICIGETINLFAGGIGGFEWSPQSNINNPFISNPYVTPTESTMYYVVLTNDFSCSKTDSIYITVNPLPIVDLGENLSTCLGNLLLITYEGEGDLLWNTGETSSSISVNPNESTIYSLTVGNEFNCFAADSVLVTVNPLPIAEAGNDASICDGSSTNLHATGGYMYEWFPSEGLDDTMISNPIANPENTITYFVSVTDSNGCVSLDSIQVSVIANPQPLISGSATVCRNQQWVAYSIPSTSNGIDWSIENGIVMSGQYTNSILIHWNNNVENGNVSVREYIWGEPNCASIVEYPVEFSTGISPESQVINVKSGDLTTGILICQNAEFEHYQWGFENKITRLENNSCVDNDWCNFVQLDTLNYYYWVKVWDDVECPTKSYFNSPEPIISSPLSITTNEISLYPNPSNGQFNLVVNNDHYGLLNITVYDVTGREVYNVKAYKNQQEWMNQFGLNNLIEGLYFVKIEFEKNSNVMKIVIE
jgi:hypothetical protein